MFDMFVVISSSNISFFKPKYTQILQAQPKYFVTNCITYVNNVLIQSVFLSTFSNPCIPTSVLTLNEFIDFGGYRWQVDGFQKRLAFQLHLCVRQPALFHRRPTYKYSKHLYLESLPLIYLCCSSRSFDTWYPLVSYYRSHFCWLWYSRCLCGFKNSLVAW